MNLQLFLYLKMLLDINSKFIFKMINKRFHFFEIAQIYILLFVILYVIFL